MAGPSAGADVDQDVTEIIAEFVELEDGETPTDCLQLDATPLAFADQRTLTYGGKDLEVRRGDKILEGGGAAIVVQCREKAYNREYALKIPRPSVLEGRTLDEIKKELGENRAEAAKQGRLSHPNVAYLVDAEDTAIPVDEVKPEGTVMVQEWIERATPLDEYIYGVGDDVDPIEELDTLVRLLREVFLGLDHLHEKDLVHWDVKAENCLVDRSADTVKIADVGNAKERSDDATFDRDTVRFTSKKCWPDAARETADSSKGSNRIEITCPAGTPSLDKPWLDLYMAGRMLARLCGIEADVGIVADVDDDVAAARDEFLDDVFGDDEHSQMVQDYLSLVVQRLLTPLAAGAPDDPDDAFYDSAEAVADDLEKLQHEFGDATDIPELYPVPQNTIRMPVTGNTEFSGRIDDLTDVDAAIRLQRHHQLGLTHFVYPGGRHSRFEHQLGTVGTTLQYVRALYADRTNPVFRLLCDSRHVRALLFAASVHDFGHGAFSHYLEEETALFGDCTHEDYIQAVLRKDLDAYDGYRTETIREDDHLRADRQALRERVEADWIRKDPPDPEEAEAFMELAADILDPTGLLADRDADADDRDDADADDSATDFNPDLTDEADAEIAAVCILHSVIDSVLDADKLDYLRRDARHAGLDYPDGADVDRFFQSLTVATQPPDGTDGDAPFRPTIAVNRKGVDSLESLLLARYQVFKSMYWHRTARAATTLLKTATNRYLQNSPDGDLPKRRERLLEEFREREDGAAIRWLLDELADDGEDVDRYRAALLGRRGLPKPIFDVSQGEVIPNYDRHTEALEKCRTIMEKNEELNQECSPREYLEARAAIREKTMERIDARLDSPAFTAGDADRQSLFIDVPLAGKDQIKNLYVADRQSRLDPDSRREDGLDAYREDATADPGDHASLEHSVNEFETFSPMADEVRTGFELWARRIRVFVWSDHPDVDTAGYVHHGELTDADTDDGTQFDDVVLTALTEAYKDAHEAVREPQADLSNF